MGRTTSGWGDKGACAKMGGGTHSFALGNDAENTVIGSSLAGLAAGGRGGGNLSGRGDEGGKDGGEGVHC